MRRQHYSRMISILLWTHFIVLFHVSASKIDKIFSKDIFQTSSKHIQEGIFGLFSTDLQLELERNNSSLLSKFITYDDVSVSEECNNAMKRWTNKDEPEIYMFYSSGLAPNSPGVFDTCNSLLSDSAHFCMVDFSVNAGQAVNLSSYWGVCAPKSCNGAEVKSKMSTMFPWYDPLIKKNVIIPGSVTVHCSDEVDGNLTGGAKGVLVVIFSFASIAIIGTIIDLISPLLNSVDDYDALVEDSEGNQNEKSSGFQRRCWNWCGMGEPLFDFLVAFSIPSNYRKLMTPPPQNDIFDLSSLNSIRVLSMFMIVMGHTIFFEGNFLGQNIVYVYSVVSERFTFQIVIGVTYAVDSFFLLSGFLVAYFLVQQLKKYQEKLHHPFGSKKIWIFYYFHRYVRLTPVLMFWVCFYWQLSKYIGVGLSPFWYRYDLMQNGPRKCDDYWWTYLLYVSNFIPANYDNACLGWLWYIANDMQYYFFAPLVILPFMYKRKTGWIVLGVLILFGWIGTIIIVEHFGFSSMFLENDFQSLRQHVYQKPHTRMSPYLIGIGLAYILEWFRDLEKENSRIILFFKSNLASRIMYASSALLFSLVVFGTYRLYEHHNSDLWSQSTHTAYITLSHSGWAMGLVLLLFPMIINKGKRNAIVELLSMDIWVPLARLTYQAYLLHPILIFIKTFMRNSYYDYNDFTFGLESISLFVMVYFLAFIGYLILEKPIMNIEKLLTMGKAKKKY